MTVIRRRPEVSVSDFRHFMATEYGPCYARIPQVKHYIQYFLDDLAADGAEEPIDAIVSITFESPEEMSDALATDEYAKAHELRQAYIRETSSGIHSGLVADVVRLVS